MKQKPNWRFQRKLEYEEIENEKENKMNNNDDNDYDTLWGLPCVLDSHKMK